MNKFLFASLAVGAVALASCSNEEFDVKPAGGEGNVVFTAQLPASVQSRAFSDGTTAKNLDYAVYAAGESTPLLTGTATFDANLKATVSTTLATGKTYDILFWAQAADAPYTFDAATQTVTVSYDGATSNAENRDAFFASELALAVNGPVSKTVTLTRPFAQLNIGTSDYLEAGAAGLKVTETEVSVAAFSSLNLATGAVTGETAVDFALAPIPTEADGAFPVDGYTYLAMNYILVPADKQTVDVTFDTNAGGTPSTFASVPVQRNYRTNIYGALLTNPAVFEVVIDKEYEGEFDFGAIVAPGVNLNEAAKTYTITSPQGLQWLSDQANGKNGAFDGYTIKLGNDIDMAGQPFTPIAKNAYFSGTFDGDGHTIANLTVSDPDCAGLVWSNRGTIKNLTMTNPNVSGNFKAGAIAGDGLCGKFDNCTVIGGTITSAPRIKDGKYDDGNNAGAITGYLSAEPNAAIVNCTVKDVTITAYRVLGAIAGTVGGTKANVTGNTAENCTVIANQLVENYDGAPKAPQAEELFGRVINGAVIGEGNTATNVTVKVIAPDSEGNLEVADAATLSSIADAINAGSTFESKTIKLTADLDLAGVEMSPLGTYAKSANGTVQNPFRGTFDGQGHTISNFTFETTEYKNGAGLFGFVINGTIKNLTLKNPKVTGTAYTGALIGLAYKGGGDKPYVTIENVIVDGATILSVPAMGSDGNYDGGNNVGGLVGLTQYGMDVQGCTVKNSTITGYAKVGGMFGLCCNKNTTAGNYTVYKNNNVENTTVKQSLTNAYEASVPTTIGEIYGSLGNNDPALPVSNTATDVTVIPAN